jgi:transposase
LEGGPVGERRRWSESFKAELVEQALEPDVNVSAIARRAGVHPAQLFAWKREALRKGTINPIGGGGPHFVEVETTNSGMIEIVVSGIVIRAGADVREEHLRRVIRAVRAG